MVQRQLVMQFFTAAGMMCLICSDPHSSHLQGGMTFSMQDGELVSSSLSQLKLHFCEPWLLGDSTTKEELQALHPLQVYFLLYFSPGLPVYMAHCVCPATYQRLGRVCRTFKKLKRHVIEGMRIVRIAWKNDLAVSISYICLKDHIIMELLRHQRLLQSVR